MGQVIVLDDGGHLDSFSNWVWKFIGLVCCISMLGLCRWISLFGVLIGFCGGCLGAVDPHILIRGRFWGGLSQLLSCCGEHHGSILMLRSLAFVRGRLCPSLAYRYQAFAAAKKHRRCNGSVSMPSNCGGGLWPILLFLVVCCRIGEAAVPGPTDHVRLGVCNPGGISSKAALFALQEADAWVVSETHLTSIGLRAFRKELVALSSPFKWIVHSKPVAPRSEVSAVGKWSGVAVIGKCPTRPIVRQWTDAQHDSCRIVAASSFCRGLWITGVGVYGCPVGPTHPHARASTESLLDLAVQRVQQSVGCRYVAGDWNGNHTDFKAIEKLRSMGWVDVQDLNFRAWGVHPAPTCRGCTRRDYLYVSPELVSRFVSCRVDDVAWSDHSSLVAEFVGSGLPDVRRLWPVPSPLDWDSTVTYPVEDFESSIDLQHSYRNLWKLREAGAVRLARGKGIEVLPSQLGRGSRVAPVPCKSVPAPLRTARQGEVEPKFLGYSLLHVHWFKQLRRLQSYCRVAGAAAPSQSQQSHAYSLWTSIISAPGFKPNFSSWWRDRLQVVGDVMTLPWTPPGVDVALSIFTTFSWEVSRLEEHLRKHKQYAARLKKVSDVRQLYKQVRRDPPEQVDVLFRETVGVVASVDTDTVAMEFDQPIAWKPDEPIFHQGRQLSTCHVEADKIWVENVADVSPGDSIVQPSHVGSLEELFRAFQDQWRSRWIRHSQVSADRWQVILAFARQHLRPVSTPALDLSPALLKAVVRSKKASAATGLDGVSRKDLLSLDSNGIASLQSLYRRASNTGQWPPQVLHGAVKSLAKCDLPSSPNHFRPVTVFSMIYRTWSSAQARFWLSSLGEALNPFLLGNRPGKQATDVWRGLLDVLESSRLDGTIASGLILDLEKAFNTLPRRPTLEAAALLGVSMDVLRAWSGALSNMARHFHVRGSYSDALMSDCGLPEGCGLSCLGMVAVNELFHLWISKSQELATAVTYVDNWEILLGDPGRITSSFQRVVEFSELMDLTLDSKKTVAWANDADTRRFFRSQGFQVALSVRELGAQVTFSAQIRNSTIVEKIRGLLDFWQKLRIAHGTYQQKLRLITTAAWPRALHGISSCYLGRKHWVSLRAACVRALKLDKPGSNSVLQLAQGRLGLDPLLYAIIQTFRDFRSYGSTDAHLVRLLEVHRGTACLPFCSVSQIVLSRLHILGWSWTSENLVQDGLSAFSLVDCGWAELEFRLWRAWTLFVARQVCHRDTLADFHLVDLRATHAAVAKLDPHEQAILRPILNGCTFTREHAFKWSQSGSLACPLCGQDDGFYHRLWVCPAASSLRNQVPSNVLSLVSSLPQSLSVHGWDLRSPTCDAWFSYFDSLPEGVLSLDLLPTAPVVDLFTDGSCWWPASEHRIASWSVIASVPPCLDMSTRGTWVLATGALPKVVQTAHRAELYALVVTAEGVRHRASQVFRIWSDCQSVVDGYNLLINGRRRLPRQHSHYDLWSRLLIAVREIGANRFLVGKVPAHQELSDELTDLERWAYLGNRSADVAAGAANRHRGHNFWKLWEVHTAATLNIRQVGVEVRQHMVRLSEFWQSQDIPEVAAEEVREQEVRHRKFSMVWEGSVDITVAQGLFSRRFCSISDRFLEWWRTGICDQAQVKWVSFGQLLIDWQIFSKHPGILLVKKVWVDPQLEGGCTPEIYPFRKRSRWWRMVVQQFLRDHGVVAGRASMCRPASEMLRCFVGCISVPWSTSRLEAVESWLRSQLKSPVLATGQVLDQLPLAG